MNKKLFTFLMCIYIPSALAEAHEGRVDSYRILKSWNIKDNKIAVVATEQGHLLGQPYQIELRAQCGKQSSEVMQWEVVDSFSVCDISPDSLKMNSQGSALAMKTKMSDLKYFDEQMNSGVISPQTRCLRETSIKKFSLQKLCPNNKP